MAKTDIWMPLYIGDYLADTAHLSTEESGAYLHLLMHQWRTGCLPADIESMRKITRIEKSSWSSAWSTLQAFFKVCQDGSYSQERLERERVSWSEKKAKAVEKARTAANSKHKSAPSMPQAPLQDVLDPCPSPTPSPSPKGEKESKAKLALELVPEPSEEELEGTGITVADYRSYMLVRKVKKWSFVDIATRDRWLKKFRSFYAEGKDTADMISQMIDGQWQGSPEEKWKRRKMSLDEKFANVAPSEHETAARLFSGDAR